MAFDAHLFAAVDDFDQKPLQQQADDGLALLLGRSVPDRRQILRQTLDRGDFLRAQGLRLLAPEPLIFGFKLHLVGQGVFPLALERAHNQTVFGLDSIILPTCSLGLVAGALDAMLPLPVKGPLVRSQDRWQPANSLPTRPARSPALRVA